MTGLHSADVETGIVRAQRVGKRLHVARLGRLAEGNPEVLSASRSRRRAEVSYSEFGQFVCQAVGVCKCHARTVRGGIEIECQKLVLIVRIGQVKRPWNIRRRRRCDDCCAVVVGAGRVDTKASPR